MRILLPILILLASCGIPKTAKFPVERVRGIDGAWYRVVKGTKIRMEAKGNDLRIQHGALNFKILNMAEFDGSYSYYTFEIVSAEFNLFYSPKGLTVRYRNEFHHWDPADLQPDVLIVIDGVDLRLEGLERGPW